MSRRIRWILMHLNCWQRLWLLATVIWLTAGGVVVWQAWQYGPPYYVDPSTGKEGSSAKSMGDYELRQVTQRVVQGDF